MLVHIYIYIYIYIFRELCVYTIYNGLCKYMPVYKLIVTKKTLCKAHDKHCIIISCSFSSSSSSSDSSSSSSFCGSGIAQSVVSQACCPE